MCVIHFSNCTKCGRNEDIPLNDTEPRWLARYLFKPSLGSVKILQDIRCKKSTCSRNSLFVKPPVDKNDYEARKPSPSERSTCGAEGCTLLTCDVILIPHLCTDCNPSLRKEIHA